MKNKVKINTQEAYTNELSDEETIFEKIYFYFFFLLPLIYSPSSVDPILIPRQIFLTLFLLINVIIIYKEIKKGKLIFDVSFVKTPIMICSILFLTTVLISFFQSLVVSESYYVFSKYALEITFFGLSTYLIIQGKIRFESLVKFLLIFGVLSCLIAYYQLFNIEVGDRVFNDVMYEVCATFGHKNLLSSILFLIFPFFIFGLKLNSTWKNVSFLLICLVILLLLFLQTRAVYFAFLFGLMISFFLVLRYNRSSMKINNRNRFLFLMFVSLIMIVFVFYQNKEKFSHLFYKTSVTERLSIWKNSSENIKENYFLGVGAGNWQVHFAEKGLDNFSEIGVRNGMTTFQRPHNDFIWILSEMGIFGLIAYLSLFALILFYCLKLIRRCEDSMIRSRFIIILSTVVGYLIIAFFDFPLERIEHQIVLYLLFAFVLASYYKDIIKERNRKIQNLVSFLYLFSILFSFIVCVNRYIGEVHTQNMYSAHRSSNWKVMIAEASEAKNMFYEFDPTSMPLDWYIGVANFSLGNIYLAKENFMDARRISPYNIHVFNNLGSCFEQESNHEMAIKYYKKALAISSSFEESILNLSAVYFNQKEIEKAYIVINTCNVNSRDSKYQTFLLAILSAKLDIEVKRLSSKEAEIIREIKKSNSLVMEIYFNSKKKGVDFINFALDYRKINK